ncbi:splicing factor Cwf22 [Schizosaccharomyces cryophilus OY26]|uniref:Splicing factor Cwf22 n=1 Tax=Schizosaccharomyces cryophilus (strain OY26 / ATCC MYA-4695 / CBS 11777 / NBRC 106824 / NRRL Y48691) TaxID=653667 RepID=S9XA08_SCHCR|nr:splicing factor Cwf22 [Schizosaccharomyces cryophilus OY26]EPY53962.1 splicing factor Cwf22 [Schizosaccharomyces cryophilus OY26]
MQETLGNFEDQKVMAQITPVERIDHDKFGSNEENELSWEDRHYIPRRTDERFGSEGRRATAAEVDPKAALQKLMNTRSGGTYVPPAKLRALQAQITDKNSQEYQRLQWEGLKKSINGLVNKVNKSNIKEIIPDLFQVNLIRGRALYCRSIMKAQAASLPFTPVYATMTAVINTKLPQVGELLLTRLIIQFRKSFRRNDKTMCISSTTFIAHLINHKLAHEIVGLQILAVLLERPTGDSIEVAAGFLREVGAYLSDISSRAFNGIFERLRTILHENQLEPRVQFIIEVLFQARKEKFKNNPTIPSELDLVEEEDQITHFISLDDELDVQESLGIFHFDPDYEENESRYGFIKREILGEDEESEEEVGSDEESADEVGSDEESEDEEPAGQVQPKIVDQTNTNIVNLRKSIYLTIMSSVDFEECCHKLLKVQLPEGQEIEMCNMIIECNSQERTYEKFYGLIGERFCKLNRTWRTTFEQTFKNYYTTIHRYETNRLRNIALFFGNLLSTNSIPWSVFECVRLTEDDTTASSRIFLKILFQELQEAIGLKTLINRFHDPELVPYLHGMFPTDEARNVRFSINYFTSIGLGTLTEEMREYLLTMPVPKPDDVSDAESYTSGSSYSRSRSPYSSDYSRSRSPSRSISPSRSRSRSYSVSDAERSLSRTRLREGDSDRGRSGYPHPDRSRSYSKSSYSSNGDSRSRSRSRSHSYDSRRQRSRSPTPVGRRSPYSTYRPSDRYRGRARRRSMSRSMSPISERSYSRSLSRGRSYSRSVSPRRDKYSSHRRYRSRSISYSPSPPRYTRRRSFSPSPNRRTKRVRELDYNRRSIPGVNERSRSPSPFTLRKMKTYEFQNEKNTTKRRMERPPKSDNSQLEAPWLQHSVDDNRHK